MNEILADIKLAIELEKKGYDFYSRTAQLAKNPLAIVTLSGLAGRELIHLNYIKEYYQSVTGEQKLPDTWLRDVQVFKKEDLLKPILAKLKGALDKKFETEAGINEAYLIAEGMEKESYELYSKLAQESSDQVSKDFYTLLAKEESTHFQILEETLQYLNNPGDWFRIQERWILEG